MGEVTRCGLIVFAWRLSLGVMTLGFICVVA